MNAGIDDHDALECAIKINCIERSQSTGTRKSNQELVRPPAAQHGIVCHAQSTNCDDDELYDDDDDDAVDACFKSITALSGATAQGKAQQEISSEDYQADNQ